MRSVKLGFLMILPPLLAHLVVNVGVPVARDVWLVSPFSWGLLFLGYWFWVGSLFGRGENPLASFLWGSSLTVLCAAIYVQQFFWTDPANMSRALSLLAQLYVFFAGPVSSTFFVSILGMSSVRNTALNLWAYVFMLGVFALGFLWQRRRQAPRPRRRKK
ncbi:MAG: hypothetical protein R6U70_09610 [Bacillota bacterium]